MRMQISLIIPLFNESLIIGKTHSSVKAFILGLEPLKAEVIYVDDGSSDGTYDIIKRECRQGGKIFKLVRHRQNLGQHSAVISGMKHSSGDLILTSDADLQTPLDNFNLLLSQLSEGDNIISGIRSNRTDPPLRKLFSFFLNLQLSLYFRKPVKDIGSMFKCYRRRAVEDILRESSKNTFIPALAMKLGYSIREIPVLQTSPARKSRYGIARLSRLYINLALETGLYKIISFLIFFVLFSGIFTVLMMFFY